ncbi:MAG: hypothetical protein VCD00_12860 [Candidatus Hydrogenedentota bacterium]
MPETRDDLETQLSEHRENKLSYEQTVIEAQKLLQQRIHDRRNDPDIHSGRDEVIDGLESTITEDRRLLAICEANIVHAQNKISNGEFASPDSSEDHDQPVSALPTVDDLINAVKRILACHIFNINHTTDRDYLLAKAFLFSRAAASLSPEDTRELKRRLSILDKNKASVPVNTATTKMPQAENNEATQESTEPHEVDAETQQHLRDALQKANANDYDAVTLLELEILAKYTKVLSTRKEVSERATYRSLQETLSTIQQRIEKIPFD